jgi:hypothetical protein
MRSDGISTTNGETQKTGTTRFQKTTDTAFLFDMVTTPANETSCTCRRISQFDPIICTIGVPIMQGNAIHFNKNLTFPSGDKILSTMSSNLFVQKPGGVVPLTYVATQTITDAGGSVSDWSTTNEWYENFVFKVEDADFIVPKEWNCPPETECKRLE